jgi:Arc/MetJ-type ribon-helix-helix transcriptional regulator
MSNALSPHIERKIAEAVAGGLYPSREALIEAGVEHLLDEQIVPMPDEHVALVEAAIESSRSGHSAQMTRQEWDELHRMVDDIATGKKVPLDNA